MSCLVLSTPIFADSYCTGFRSLEPGVYGGLYFSFGRDYLINSSGYSACDNSSAISGSPVLNTDFDYDFFWSVMKPANASINISRESHLYIAADDNDLEKINCYDPVLLWRTYGQTIDSVNLPPGYYDRFCFLFPNATLTAKIGGPYMTITGTYTNNTGGNGCPAGGAELHGYPGWTNASIQIPDNSSGYNIYYRYTGDEGTVENLSKVYINGINTLNLSWSGTCTFSGWQDANAGDNITIEHRGNGYFTNIVRIEYSVANVTRYGAIKVLNNSATTGFSFYFAIYQEEYFIISNVRNYPEIPQPNSTLRVYWDTSLAADSKLAWRSAPYYNTSDVTAWAYVNDSATTTTHQMNISNTQIIENRFYQYYVISNRSGTAINDTNGGVYYNFTVGGPGSGIYTGETAGKPWENETLRPDNPIHDASEKLSSLLDMDMTTVYAAVFFLLLLMMTVAALWVSNNIAVGGAVFLVGAALFSLFTYLPYYVFMIIAIIFAVVMVLIFKGLFD